MAAKILNYWNNVRIFLSERAISGKLIARVSASAIGMLSQMPSCPMSGVRTNNGISTKTMLRQSAMTTDSIGRSIAV